MDRALITTAANEIDRKLHRIILDSDSEKYNRLYSLAKFIEDKKYSEFSYMRLNKTQYTGAHTIQTYISYAREIGLLSGDLQSIKPKSHIRSLENFQSWLSDNVLRYLKDKNSSIDKISEIIHNLLQKDLPLIIPTQEHIYSRLGSPPPPKFAFHLSLKIVSLLRPQALRICSRRLVIIPKILKD